MSEIDLSSPLNYGTPSSLGSFRTPGGVRGTPIRIRSDIQSERKLRQVNVATGSQAPGSSSRGEAAGKNIYHCYIFIVMSHYFDEVFCYQLSFFVFCV